MVLLLQQIWNKVGLTTKKFRNGGFVTKLGNMMVPTKMWKNHSFTTNKLENYGSIYSEKIENFGFYEEQWR